MSRHIFVGWRLQRPGLSWRALQVELPSLVSNFTCILKIRRCSQAWSAGIELLACAMIMMHG